MNDDVAISVKKVSKNFKLPHEKADSIKSLFVNPFDKKRKRFEIQHALKNISFEVKKGEFFGIVGRNGSGKSTLLKIIAGIYQPNKGKVLIDGKLVPFIELGVGFNPQLTGRENVYLNGALLGFSEKEVDKKYKSIVDFAELDDFMDQKLKNYSSGMQVRLSFSVATVLAESDILLIDEVLAVGDADFQRKCFEYFNKLKKDKKTVVFVSHDMEAVKEYCDRAIMINEGGVEIIGSTDEVAASYMKLFTTNDKSGSVEDSVLTSNRWGNGDLKFNKIEINKNSFDSNDKNVIIKAHYSTFKSIKNPIFGFSIKNSTGTRILGTNTKIQNVKISECEIGVDGCIEWSIPNIFNDGEYIVDVAAIHEDTITQYDWWEDSKVFKVFKPNHSSYIVEPPVDVNIKKV